MSDPAVAWVVLLVDGQRAVPELVGAIIAPTPSPVPPPEAEAARTVAVLCEEGADYLEAEAAARELLAAPAWRWIYRLRILGPGFRHVWHDYEDGRRCERCGLSPADAVAARGARARTVCLVSHVGRCAACGGDRPIMAGSASCIACELEEHQADEAADS